MFSEKTMQMDRILKFALISLAVNIAYSIYHVVVGVSTRSWWLFTIGIYYVILSTVRFVIIRHKVNKNSLLRFTGIMLMMLSVSLIGTVILAFVKDRGKAFHLIVMLTIAVYAFSKITLATIKLIKARKSRSAKTVALRNISFADALVSIFSLQRSMLVSFEGMSETNIRIMNVATGSAVCITVFLLGLHLIKRKAIHTRKDRKEIKPF